MALSVLSPPAKKARVEDGSQGQSEDHVITRDEMCIFYQQNRCTKGYECGFAHSPADLGTPITQRMVEVRKMFCRFYHMEGTCKWGNECGFAHGEAELNTPLTQKMNAPLTLKLASMQATQRGVLPGSTGGATQLPRVVPPPGGSNGAVSVNLSNAVIADMTNTARESASLLVQARVEDTQSCAGCGMIGHTFETCPFATALGAKPSIGMPSDPPAQQAPLILSSPYQPKSELPNQTMQKKGEVHGVSQGETDDYVIRRLEMCTFYQQGRCTKGYDCGYAHSEADLGTPITQSMIGVRKMLCKFYQSQGSCKWGNNCGFAHGEAELNTPISQKMNAPISQKMGGAHGTHRGVLPGSTGGATPLPGAIPAQGGVNGAAPAELNNATIADMIKIAGESASWLVQAATYCTSNSETADLESVLETATEAAQRAAWVHDVVMVYEPPPGETADAAEMAFFRNAAIEAKEKAERAYLTCQQLLNSKRGRKSSFEVLLAQAQANQVGQDWCEKPITAQASPDVYFLSLICTERWKQNTSQLLKDGYPSSGVAVLYTKACDVFSEAHHILQVFFGNQYVRDLITVDHDSDAAAFPEVYEAWKAKGGADWPMTIARCNQLKKWGAGFAGRKNGEKAAKLALALSVAGGVDSHKLQKVITNYPAFGKLVTGQ